MANYRIISQDDHVYEPKDLWTSRIDPEFKDRAPRIVQMDDGDWWYADGIRAVSAGAGAQAGRRFEEPEKLTNVDYFANVRLGGYIPEEHVKDMEIDGLDVSIVYPTVGLTMYQTQQDSRLLSAICKAYNSWVAEFCSPFPKRIKAIGMLNVDDVQDGVKELEHCAKMGLIGGIITVYPPEGRAYNSAEYEPLWAAAQDLQMPLSLHIATNRPSGPEQEWVDIETVRQAFFTNVDHWVRMSLADIIFTGVLERYPKLQVGSIEMELSWAPHFLDRMDYTYTQRVHPDWWYTFKNNMLPSDFFHRNVFLGFQEDALGVSLRHHIGVDNLQWGSDYPHFESTFPRSQEILEEILVDCTEEEKAKIAGGNTARVYRLD